MIKLTKFLDSLLFFLVIFLFAFIPLYPKFPLLNIKGTFVAIRIEDIIIGLTVFLWAINLKFSNNIKSFLNDKLNQVLLLFFSIGALSIFSAILLTNSVIPHIGILHFLRRIEFMILLPIVGSVVTTRKKFILILFLLALTVLAANIYALGQQHLGWVVISTTNSEFSKGLFLRLTPGARVNSTFAGHYDFAVFLTMSIVILVALFFSVKKGLKIIVSLLGIFSMLVLIMTAARQSFVATFVGIISALILSHKKKYILFIVIATMIILIYPSQLRDRFVSTIMVNVFNLGRRYEGKTEDQQKRAKLNIPTLAIQTSSDSANTSTFANSSGSSATDITPGEPIDTTQLGVYRSLQIRLNIEWPRAIRAFIKNPFLGTGYSSIDIATDNDFLRSLGEVGALGTIAIVLIFIEIGKRILSGISKIDKLTRYFSAGVFSMMIAFIINGLFIDVFEASKVAALFWMILGLNLAIVKFKDLNA